MKVLEVEYSGLHPTFLFVYCVHSACGYVSILVYPFFSYACFCRFTWYKFDILVNVAIVYRLMLNDITLFLFS